MSTQRAMPALAALLFLLGPGTTAAAEPAAPAAPATAPTAAPATAASANAEKATDKPAEKKVGSAAAAFAAAANAAAKPAAAPDQNSLVTNVVGSQEAPTVMNVVPWKDKEVKLEKRAPTTAILNQVLQPLDRDVLRREVQYFRSLQEQKAQ